MNRELLEKYLSRMKEQLSNDDTEAAHSEADDILCELLTELGYDEIVDIFYEIDKWYA